MKEKITRLFQCAMFLVEEVSEEELKETFKDEEIRYAKAIINYLKLKNENK